MNRTEVSFTLDVTITFQINGSLIVSNRRDCYGIPLCCSSVENMTAPV